MSDPLGLIGSSGGARPIQPTPPARTPAGGKPSDPNAPSFKDLLLEELRDVNKLQTDVARAIEDLQTGKRDDPENVIMAMQDADNAFRMLLQVRNKMVDAYNELRQVRV